MNKFGKTPFEKVKNVIVSFYDPDEIVLAKEILHAEVLKLKLDEAPRLKRRSVSYTHLTLPTIYSV